MPLKQRHNLIRPIKKAKFSYRHVRKLGFNVSKELWKNCNDSSIRKLGFEDLNIAKINHF
jgi:hypothetical protein